jgi:hypothetical protein
MPMNAIRLPLRRRVRSLGAAIYPKRIALPFRQTRFNVREVAARLSLHFDATLFMICSRDDNQF